MTLIIIIPWPRDSRGILNYPNERKQVSYVWFIHNTMLIYFTLCLEKKNHDFTQSFF